MPICKLHTAHWTEGTALCVVLSADGAVIASRAEDAALRTQQQQQQWDHQDAQPQAKAQTLGSSEGSACICRAYIGSGQPLQHILSIDCDRL